MKKIVNPFLYTLILLLGASNLMAQCNHQDDYSSLRALYLSTDGDNWMNNTNWPDSAFFVANLTAPAGLDMSSWFGIGCNVGGRVDSVVLDNNKLIGELPEGFYNLTEVEVIDLSSNMVARFNKLTGEISNQISNLINLKILRFKWNKISGEIPVEIGNLVNLEELELVLTDLTGQIPKELGNLINLKELRLSSNDMSGEIPVELSNLNSLEVLDLSSNDMSGEIPVELSNLNSLQVLDLSSNDMSGEIPVELSNLNSLEVLDLSSNDISGEIPMELSNLNSLQVLDLSSNDISGEIPTELGSLINLETLEVQKNEISGEIPVEIGLLVNLRELNLGSNKISGEISSEIGNLINLRQLKLSDNKLSGELPIEFGSLLSLEYLGLSNNQFEGSIPNDMEFLKRLISVDLHHNNFTGRIPVFFRSYRLHKLVLYANDFYGEIPKEIKYLTNLQDLELDSNRLTGEIPTVLGDLSQLTDLWLNNNQFVGSIPSNLGNLSKLRLIELSNNELSGCYDINLLNFCDLGGGARIDYGNNFDAAWSDFCSSGSGLCYCSSCVSGRFYFDFNNDGCDALDSTFSNIPLVVINDSIVSNYTAFSSGQFVLPLKSGFTKIVPEINTDYFSLEPDTAFVSWSADSLNLTHDFCITPLGDFDDLKITVLPLNAARPGFTSRYKIVYENQGTTTSSGKVSFTYFNSDVITFLNSSPYRDSLSGNSVIWEYNNLKPFEKRELRLTMKLNTPTDTPPLVGGEDLNFVAKVFPIMDDETPDDNEFYLNQTVVNSYDPNDKNCLEGSILTEEMIGSDVTYMIRFENTGTASAVNIKVTDTINTELFDIETLRLVEASHPCRFVVEGNNVVHFYFDEIYLPYEDATNDGYVVFKIQTLPTLVVGDSLTNFADIYFDFNPAIRTNTSTTYVREIIPLDISLSATSAEVCSGEKVYVQGLARGGTGNYTYSWSSSQSDFSSDDNNIIDSPTEDVKYILVVDDGETTIQDTIDIRVFESPELSLDITKPSCFGDCDGFMTYAIDGGTGPFVVDSSKLFNLCADDYYFTVRDVNGCRDRVDFEVDEPEEIVITSLTKDSTFTYTGGVGEVRPIFEVHGIFLVLTLEDDKGCIGKDSIALSSISNTLLEEHIQMFPNPVHQSLQIKSAYKFYEVSITDALGKTVQIENLNTETKDYTIPFSELNAGVYFVELKGREFRYVKRALKQ